ncbi:signal peptidase I [Geodermatophilus tzadiensis]|uniref:Signal peptidase I n=1 Tax=Geodermatophilus tzadiensis TaxID=1137988 RepID=A0A2T0TZF4_9ACTN|nr:signal peptidase I [Geodermatophilus tzadiensis]PRY51057.1 signal peptidase I [Geodermatophilus tzadiensis]
MAGRGPGLTRRTPPAAPWRLLRRTGRLVVPLAVVLALVLAASVTGLLPVHLVRVGAQSMQPTLAAGDLVLVDRGAGPVGRGEVVAARHPGTGELVVKRVVGLPGDRVALEDGALVVDGTAVCETSVDAEHLDGVWFGPVTVEEGRLFLLGDARADSVDSRVFGAVPSGDVVGVVSGRVWPDPGALPSTSC